MKPKKIGDTSESTRDIGTAKKLYGKIYVIMIFVGPYSNPWSRSDTERFKQKVMEAEHWLKIQALKYGKQVEFVNSAFGADGSFCDNDIPVSCDAENAYSYPSSIFLRIGFKSKEAFVNWVYQNTDCTQCFAIIFPNSTGRNYASPVTKEAYAFDKHQYNLESCLLYRYYSGTMMETRPTSIAHEILHLFGAWDLYELDELDHDRFAKTEIMFPNSIMIDSHRDIWETQIDEITAWLVGLKDEGEDWYRWFEPGQNSYLTE